VAAAQRLRLIGPDREESRRRHSKKDQQEKPPSSGVSDRCHHHDLSLSPGTADTTRRERLIS